MKRAQQRIIKWARRGALAGALLAASGCAALNKKAGGGGADSDYVSGTPLPDRADGVAFTGPGVDKQKFPPVYFAYDSYAIQPGEEPKLDEVAGAMKAGSGTVIIAGFTDERGTEEYNRGLGERRALIVREALIGRGLSPAKLQTVSFGEEMPAATGGGEDAWAKNRRAEFGVVR